MAKVKAKVSAVVSQQVPEFVREDHPQFVNFLEAYYEWLEQNYALRNIESYIDIDDTIDEYVEYFADQIANLVPKNLVADKRLMLKHAKELYVSKGTPQSYNLLFRLMFDEVPQQIYYPKTDMLRISDGKWASFRIVRGVDLIGDSFELVGQIITQDPFSGLDKGATGRVESVVKYNVGVNLITEITISDEGLLGEFEPNQIVYGISTVTGERVEIELIPFVPEVIVNKRGKYYASGDLVSVVSGDGEDFRGEVGSISNGSVKSVAVLSPGENHFYKQPVLFDNTDAGYGGSTGVESATAYVDELEFGYFLLEDTVRWSPGVTYNNLGERIVYKNNEYEVVGSGTASFSAPPTHKHGTQFNGTARLKYVGRTSGKLVYETEDEISLEEFRYYKTDEFGNYDASLPERLVSGGGIKTIKVTNGGKHYNSLPAAYTITDYIDSITTTAGSNTVRVTTSLAHELLLSQRIIIGNTVNDIVNGVQVVSAIIDNFTFEFQSSAVTKIQGSLAKFHSIPVFYADRSNNENAVRKNSTVKLQPLSDTIGQVQNVIVADFGYDYNSIGINLPANLQLTDVEGLFLIGEQVLIQPQTFSIEKTGDELLFEDGTKIQLEQQSTAAGTVLSWDPLSGRLQLSPADNTFIPRATIVGQTSGSIGRILDGESALIEGVIKGVGVTSGKFLNSDGKVSDGSKKIQDSFYYQDYSYVIRIGQSVNKYRDAVKKLLHPVGLALFGEVSLITAVRALMRIMNDNKAVLTSIVDIRTRATMLAIGNWQEQTYRLLVDNSDLYGQLELEGGFREVLANEDGKGFIITEDFNQIVSERSDPDGRKFIFEDRDDHFTLEVQDSIYFKEHIIGETSNFFRLENDPLHTKARFPNVRREDWVIKIEDFVPSYFDSDTIKLETANEDNDGIVDDQGNDLLLETGGRILNQIQLSKPAPSISTSSSFFEPTIIQELPYNIVHLLEMTPEAFKEIVFRIKTKVAMDKLQRGFFLLEDGDYLLLENGDKLALRVNFQYPENKTEQYVSVTSNPNNVELDNLLLENGFLFNPETNQVPALAFTATIDAALAGSQTLNVSIYLFDIFNGVIYKGMRVTEGAQVIYSNKYNMPAGTVGDVTTNNDFVEFTIFLDVPLEVDKPETEFVSLYFEQARNKFILEGQSQKIFAGNFKSVQVPSADGYATVIERIRPQFRPAGSSLTFLEQRKFGIAPYTTGAKGSLQVVPGTVWVGVDWEADTEVLTKQILNHNGNAYEVTTAGTTDSSTAPTHTSGTQTNGTAELTYFGPSKQNIQYLPDSAEGGFTGGWYLQYPANNRELWNNEFMQLETGDVLLNETGSGKLLEVSAIPGDTQIKHFANITVYDLINRKYKRTKYAVDSYIEIYRP